MAQAGAGHEKTGGRRWLCYLVCFAFFAAHCVLWIYSNPLRTSWANVPPPPTTFGASLTALGDQGLAYRTYSVMLQNLGDIGGRVTMFRDYDFDMVGRWFFLLDKLDPVSQYVPYLAAFYYGATEEKEQLRPVVDYLAAVGRRPGAQRWRWMGQAVFLARFRLDDLDLALKLSHELAALDEPGMPRWTKQMPAFVMNAQGDRAASYQLLLTMLREEADQMQPAEVNFIIWYMCERLLAPDEAKADPVCAIKEHR